MIKAIEVASIFIVAAECCVQVQVAADVDKALDELSVGQQVTLKLQRATEMVEVSLQLEETSS